MRAALFASLVLTTACNLSYDGPPYLHAVDGVSTSNSTDTSQILGPFAVGSTARVAATQGTPWDTDCTFVSSDESVAEVGQATVPKSAGASSLPWVTLA